MALTLPAAAADAASLFKGESGRTSIEVHVDDRQIIFLKLDGPTTCQGGFDYEQPARARTRMPISLDPETGAFSFVHREAKYPAYNQVHVTGTILEGRLRASYEYGYTDGDGRYCWSGERLRGSPAEPAGSPVRISISRREGLRFFEQEGDQQIYMWIGRGKVHGFTARLTQVCEQRSPGFPPIRNFSTALLAPNRVLSVNRRTREIRFRKAVVREEQNFRDIWKLDAIARPGSVRGEVSHVYRYDLEDGGGTYHCQTGGPDGPAARFVARRS